MPLVARSGAGGGLAYDVVVRRVKRALLAASAILAGLVYVWISAVRAVPGVRRRKAERRAKR